MIYEGTRSLNMRFSENTHTAFAFDIPNEFPNPMRESECIHYRPRTRSGGRAMKKDYSKLAKMLKKADASRGSLVLIGTF